jgi:hypothetical protein
VVALVLGQHVAVEGGHGFDGFFCRWRASNVYSRPDRAKASMRRWAAWISWSLFGILNQDLAPDDLPLACEGAPYLCSPGVFKTVEAAAQGLAVEGDAYCLLDEWKTPPGSTKDCTFNGNALAGWLKQVIASSSESGHLDQYLRQKSGCFRMNPADFCDLENPVVD